MCLAIYKPANTNVPDDHLEEGFLGNPDGAGFAYVQDGCVRYMKGFFDFATFLANYKERVKDEYPAVIHFRWATVGAKTADNCHPFPSGNGGVLIHNGPQIQKLGTADKSDSRVFAEEIMQPLSREALHQTKPIIEGYLGYNKVVVLFPDEAVILNEDLGHWEKGVWYSNDGYKASYSRYSWGSYKSSRSSMTDYSEDDAYYSSYPKPTALTSAAEDSIATFDDMLTEEQIAKMLDTLPAYMLGYIAENIDTDNHFYDADSKRWYFYDRSYEEFVDLETGLSVEEYYEEVLGIDLSSIEDPEAPVEAGDETPLTDEDEEELLKGFNQEMMRMMH